MAGLNSDIQNLATQASQSDLKKLEAQRQSLIAAYQQASTLGTPDAVQQAMAAVGKLKQTTAAKAAGVTAGNDAWLKREADFDAALVKIGELEDTGHPKAPAYRKLAEAIRDRANDKNYSDANAAFDQLQSKLNEPMAQPLMAGTTGGNAPGGGGTVPSIPGGGSKVAGASPAPGKGGTPSINTLKPSSTTTGSITITVKDGLTQKPVKAAVVTVEKFDSVKNESQYTFMEVPVGAYQCTCHAKNYGIFMKSVVVQAGKDTPVEISLIPTSSVKDEIAKGEKQIQQATEDLTIGIDKFFDSYWRALHNFSTAMLDSDIEEESGKSLIEVAFSLLAPITTFVFPEAGIVMAAVKKLKGDMAVHAATALKEFTTNVVDVVKNQEGVPTSGREFRAFIKEQADGSPGKKADMKDTALAGRDKVQEAYSAMAREEGSVTGVAAQYLQVAVDSTRSLAKTLRTLGDTNKLEEKITTEFAGKQGRTPTRTSVLDSTRDAGTLYFEISAVIVDKNDPKSDFFLGDDTDTKWKLVMLGNKKDAEGAARSLKDSVKIPWNIHLPRKVGIWVYDGRNKRDHQLCAGWMVFNKGNTGTRPDSFEDLRGSYSGWDTGKTPEEWIKLAWANSKVRDAAVKNEDLEGSTS